MSSLDIIRGRQVVVPLTNKSGGALVNGDVVIVDTGNDAAVTTTTDARATVSVGIVQESIASNAVGRVLVSGYASLVNVPASVTRGHFVETHTVAKQAVGNSARRSGSFGQFLTGGATPTAWLYGFPDGTVSGIAETLIDATGDLIVGSADNTADRLPVGANTYVLTADDGETLGVKWAAPGGGGTDVVQVASGAGSIIIPGLSASPDIRVAGTDDDEFDVTDASDPMTGWTTLGSPTTHNVNSTVKSHYYLLPALNASADWEGIYKAPPSTPFTVTAKLGAVQYSANYGGAGLFVGESTPGKMDILQSQYSDNKHCVALEYFTSPSAYSSTPGSSLNAAGFAPVWLRIVVTSSSDIAYYWSRDGILWIPLVTGRDPGFTVGAVGLTAKTQNASATCEAAFDWIRFRWLV